ncbi:hypothetical protein BC827DRAFT_1159245 [Russula dissimulans]|nr:hypothetical protein BC827DRAFT_1159245 [Russula dissimulans]
MTEPGSWRRDRGLRAGREECEKEVPGVFPEGDCLSKSRVLYQKNEQNRTPSSGCRGWLPGLKTCQRGIQNAPDAVKFDPSLGHVMMKLTLLQPTHALADYLTSSDTLAPTLILAHHDSNGVSTQLEAESMQNTRYPLQPSTRQRRRRFWIVLSLAIGVLLILPIVAVASALEVAFAFPEALATIIIVMAAAGKMAAVETVAATVATAAAAKAASFIKTDQVTSFQKLKFRVNPQSLSAAAVARRTIISRRCFHWGRRFRTRAREHLRNTL